MPDSTILIQLQSMVDEIKDMRMRMERTERRMQMLTDSFVVANLWRTSSSIDSWKGFTADQDMLQFDMTND